MTRRRALALDVAVALVLTVPSVALALHRHGFGAVGLGLAVGIGLWSAAVAWRSTAPFVMAVTMAAGMLVFLLVPGHHSDEPFIASLVVPFCTATQLRGRSFWLAVALLFAVGYPMNYDDPAGRSTLNLLLSPLILLGAPMLTGALLRRYRDQGDRLRRLSDQLAAERELHARAAAAAERNRIARDLHDVVAHSVSAMVVQAGAAEAQLDPGSPAHSAVAAVRRTGKEALVELRRQLGVLREASV